MNISPINSNNKYNRPSFSAKLKITRKNYDCIEPYTNKFIERCLSQFENEASSFGKPNDIIELRFSMPKVDHYTVQGCRQGIFGVMECSEKSEGLIATYQSEGNIIHRTGTRVDLNKDSWGSCYSEEELGQMEEVKAIYKCLDVLKTEYQETTAELRKLLKLEKQKRKRVELDKIKKQREEELKALKKNGKEQ